MHGGGAPRQPVPGAVATAGTAGLPRRAVLRLGATGALATGALAGCRIGGEPTPEPSPHPLEVLVDGARALVDTYDTAIAQAPALAARLDPLRDDHRAHVAALLAAIGRKPGGTPTGSPSGTASASPPAGTGGPDPAEVLHTLAAAEREAQRQSTAACVSLPGRYAALLGSITACRASHVEALR